MNMWRFVKENKGFALVLFAAALVRLIPLFHYQFSYDELSALSRTMYGSWHDLLQYGAQIDAHPVLIQCFLFAWVKITGYSAAWVKLPFILFSLGGIVYAYLFAQRWFGRVPALMSAVVYSFSFIFVYYSPLARMYSSGLFFSTAFLYYWFIVMFDENRSTKHFTFMALFIFLSALNSHIGCLFVMICGFAGLFFIPRKELLRYVLFCAATVALYLPHLPITLFQLDYGGIGAGQDGWLAAPDKFVLLSLLRVIFGTGWVWALFLAGFLGAFMINNDLISRKAVLLLVLFMINYGIIHLYSVLKAPVFQYSVMLMSAPCLVLGACSMFRNESRWMHAFVWLVAAVLFMQTFYVKGFYKNCVRNQNESQYRRVAHLEKEYGKRSVEAVFFDTEKLFVLLYEVKNKKPINYHLGSDTIVSNIAAFRRMLMNSKAEHLVLGNATPKSIAMCREFFPYISFCLQNPNINLCELGKRKEESVSGRFFRVIDSTDYIAPLHYEYHLNKELSLDNGHLNYKVDSLNEYPFMVKAPVAKISSHEGQIILATATLISKEPLRDVGIEYSITNAKDSVLFYGGEPLKPYYTANGEYKAYAELYLGSEYKYWHNDHMKLFFWNRSRQDFMIRDLEVQTIDYWPLKWRLWE